MLARRGLFGSLISALAAPAVVKAESLMPIKPQPVLVLVSATSQLSAALADTIEQYGELRHRVGQPIWPGDGRVVDRNFRPWERRQRQLEALEQRIAQQSQALQDVILGMTGAGIDPKLEYWLRLGGRGYS
jgi:hypothetical protein